MADKEEELNNPEQNLYKNDPKKFIPKLYNFKVSKCNAFNETVLASSPPFWVLVDHLVGVVWKLYSKEKDGRKLGIMQLQWALEFIKMIKDDRGNLTKTLEAVKNTIEDSLILKYACLPTGDKRKKCEEPEDDGKQRPTVKSFEGLPQTSQSASLTLRDVMSRLPKTETLRPTATGLPLDGTAEVPISSAPSAPKSSIPTEFTMKMEDILKYLMFLKKEQQTRISKEQKELERLEDAINQVEAGQFNIESWMNKGSQSNKENNPEVN
ncbi:hypothetical protein O3M35_012688 [Rhynocoris fuscipes]|uniref:Uncharacterized protein n=1 Tax=Rhynocoris fuscipes TaxID=488301 RepID=A0AAW1CUH5_9HEMI